MLRTLLTWRWLALTLVLLAAVAGMVALGGWQWDRSVPEPERAAVDLATVRADDLPDALAVTGATGAAVPVTASGELVRVTGTWRADRTLEVADRDLDGREGRWAVTAVEVATEDGPRLLPVVRGWLPAEPGRPATGTAGPQGPADVIGWVQQSEPLDLPHDVVQPEGVVALLSTADLANRWPEELVPGFVVAAPTPDQVAAAGDLVPLGEPPAEQLETRDWRNLAYSAQWFVFAGFAVVLWWRMLRDDVARRDQEGLDPDPTPDPQRREATPAPRERSTT